MVSSASSSTVARQGLVASNWNSRLSLPARGSLAATSLSEPFLRFTWFFTVHVCCISGTSFGTIAWFDRKPRSGRPRLRYNACSCAGV